MHRPEKAPDSVRNFVDDVYRRYGKALHAYLRRRLRRPKDADDLAQEVYARLLRSDRQKFIRNPQAYVYGIAGHVLSYFRQREEKDQERLEFTHELADASALNANPFADEHAERLNLQRQLQCALAQLPELHAEIFLCIKREGLSYAETGRRLRMTPKAVERYFCEAKARLAMLSWDR